MNHEIDPSKDPTEDPNYPCRWYVLNDHGEPIQSSDTVFRFWQMCDMISGRKQFIVAITRLDPETMVATRFTGMDMSGRQEGAPVVWETELLCSRLDPDWVELQQCHGSREQAEAMHADCVNRLRQAGKENA